ncbi:MAG TPA: hypothetical protein VEZ41_01410 [Allosphingosinicella sp.]|nr:hypothetical protein [Allosphingosinicella sp.]
MSLLDEIAITESLRSYGVTSVQPKELYFVGRHPIDEFLSVAAERLTVPFKFMVSEQGAPDHFFLSGFDSLPLVFSARYMGLTARILQLLRSQTLAAVRDGLAEGIAFDTIAEFLLLEKNPILSALAFMKARVASRNIFMPDPRSMLGVGSDLLDLECRAFDEFYVTDMFFGLGHELGHAIQEVEASAGAGAPWCSDEAILQLVEEAASLSRGDAGLSFREVGASRTVGCERLRREAGADIEGCRLVARSASRIFANHAEPDFVPNLNALVEGLVTNFVVLGFINGCRRTAILASLAPGEQEKALELVQQPLAFAVRQGLLQAHLPVVIRDLFGDGLAATFGEGVRDIALIEPETRRFFDEMWNAAIDILQGDFAGVERGLLRAMEFFNRPLSGEDLAELTTAYGQLVRSGDVGLAEARFMELAETMALGPDIVGELTEVLSLASGAGLRLTETPRS